MPIGDSITYGSVPGGYRTDLWIDLVKKSHDKIDFVGSQSSGPAALGDKDNEGNSGWCIDGPCGGVPNTQVYPKLHEWMMTYRPDVVSLHLGTNDLQFGANGPTVAYRLDQAIAQIYTDNPNVYIVVAKIIPMKGADRAWADYNSYIPQIVDRYSAKGRRIAMVDLSSVVQHPDDFADALHPNAGGYSKMATAMYPALQGAYLAVR
jgi:lysophospholipase L1-like esterase